MSFWVLFKFLVNNNYSYLSFASYLNLLKSDNLKKSLIYDTKVMREHPETPYWLSDPLIFVSMNQILPKNKPHSHMTI